MIFKILSEGGAPKGKNASDPQESRSSFASQISHLSSNFSLITSISVQFICEQAGLKIQHEKSDCISILFTTFSSKEQKIHLNWLKQKRV